jgi:hypothetical protein
VEGRRIDEVRVELRGGVVSIPLSSCDALLERLGSVEAMSEVREAFQAVGTTGPVRLTDPQKLELRDAIAFWANQLGGSYDDLPEGISDLRDALQDDRLDVEDERPESG